MINDLMQLLDDYQYWVIGLEYRGDNPDGSRHLAAREGFDFAECVRRLEEMPPAGTLEDLRSAIEIAKHEQGAVSHET